jgi:hypothetical protein
MDCPNCGGKDELGDLTSWKVKHGKYKHQTGLLTACYACGQYYVEIKGELILIDLPENVQYITR